MSVSDVLTKLEPQRANLRKFGVRRLGVFGSVARNEDGPQSDLDFVVEFSSKSFDNYMGLKLFLEDLFGRRVDLVILDSVKPRIKPVIEREAVYAKGL